MEASPLATALPAATHPAGSATAPGLATASAAAATFQSRCPAATVAGMAVGMAAMAADSRAHPSDTADRRAPHHHNLAQQNN